MIGRRSSVCNTVHCRIHLCLINALRKRGAPCRLGAALWTSGPPCAPAGRTSLCRSWSLTRFVV